MNKIRSKSPIYRRPSSVHCIHNSNFKCGELLAAPHSLNRCVKPLPPFTFLTTTCYSGTQHTNQLISQQHTTQQEEKTVCANNTLWHWQLQRVADNIFDYFCISEQNTDRRCCDRIIFLYIYCYIHTYIRYFIVKRFKQKQQFKDSSFLLSMCSVHSSVEEIIVSIARIIVTWSIQNFSFYSVYQHTVKFGCHSVDLHIFWGFVFVVPTNLPLWRSMLQFVDFLVSFSDSHKLQGH